MATGGAALDLAILGCALLTDAVLLVVSLAFVFNVFVASGAMTSVVRSDSSDLAVDPDAAPEYNAALIASICAFPTAMVYCPLLGLEHYSQSSIFSFACGAVCDAVEMRLR